MNAAELAQAYWNSEPLYLTEERRYSAYPWLYEAAEFRHHAGERVLEVGCGSGCDLFQFAKHGAIATGIDITDLHLQLARERVNGKATVVYGDGTSMPFKDETFAYVYSHGVIHHIDQPKQAVGEILRVLKPGGRFNIHVYAWFAYLPMYLVFTHGRQWKRYVETKRGCDVHIDLYSARTLRQLFSPVPISIRKYECHPFQWLAPIFGWFLVAKGRKP